MVIPCDIPEAEWLQLQSQLDRMWLVAEIEFDDLVSMLDDESIHEKARAVISLVVAEVIDRKRLRETEVQS